MDRITFWDTSADPNFPHKVITPLMSLMACWLRLSYKHKRERIRQTAHISFSFTKPLYLGVRRVRSDGIPPCRRIISPAHRISIPRISSMFFKQNVSSDELPILAAGRSNERRAHNPMRSLIASRLLDNRNIHIRRMKDRREHDWSKKWEKERDSLIFCLIDQWAECEWKTLKLSTVLQFLGQRV